jgi:hypothetical protein
MATSFDTVRIESLRAPVDDRWERCDALGDANYFHSGLGGFKSLPLVPSYRDDVECSVAAVP